MKRLDLFMCLTTLVFISLSCEQEINPVANFSFTENGNFAPSSVSFSNSSSNGSSYLWEFGDGQTSTQQNPNHLYTSGGLFNVTLKVKNSVGIENILNKTVNIKDTPTKLKINSIVLTAYPIATASGGGWDLSSGPDIFTSISDSTRTLSLIAGRKEDMLTNNLPYTFSSGFPIMFSDFDFKNTIEFYDYDPIGSDEWMGGYYFSIRNHMPINGSLYPNTVSFQSESSDLKFTINIEWIL